MSKDTSNSQKTALITGITGQDGSYLAELLLDKGYEVHGIKRKASTFNTERIDHLYTDPHKDTNLFLHYGDIMDGNNVENIIFKVQPDEVYHLAAQSHVKVSFEMPVYTGDITGLGTTRLLEAIRKLDHDVRFYQASTSEMFGNPDNFPITEETPFAPRSPYAAAKLYAYWITRNYRESYDLFACNGILFNHESPRRGKTFVTRKITRGLARIKLGIDDRLFLGNMEAKRDWGHARDYVEGMWKMLQADEPDDYILSTGETHSVRECVEVAAKEFGFDLEWKGSGVDEIGIDKNTGDTIIEIDPQYFRPAEVDVLIGDYTKAKEKLGWEPRTTFKELIQEMCKKDLKAEKNNE